MTSKPVIALIGAGAMGSNHARVVGDSGIADLGVVVDRDLDAARRLAATHDATATDDLEAALQADGAIVAASTAAHHDCVVPLLEHGVPTFVEKPIACDAAEVVHLLDLAERTDTPLMCGFVERFNAAYRTAVSQLTDAPTHVLAVRHSPPAPRIASGVVGDLLLHDLDLVIRLFGHDEPRLGNAATHRPTDADFDEIADCQLFFPSGIANLSADRMSQVKVRTMTVHTPSTSIDVDLLRQNVTVYRNTGDDVVQDRFGYRSTTTVDIPFIRHRGEPLVLQFEHFVGLIDGTVDHVAERESARPAHRVMAMIEDATR